MAHFPFHVINLGCKVNKVESDSFAAQLLNAGGEISTLEEARIIVVNTCAVTGEAEKKTRKAVRHACNQNPSATLVVTGCSAALHPEVFEEMSSSVRVAAKTSVAAVLSELAPVANDSLAHELPVGEKFRTRVGVKVQDGCNNACTYCIVHVARGTSVSRPAKDIVADVRALVEAGVREIVLTGINLGSFYDNALPGEGRLASLLAALLEETSAYASEDSLVRFRVSSVEPCDVDDKLIDVIAASNGRICQHLHLPLQAGSSKVLAEMNRPYSADEFRAIVARLKAGLPRLSLSTDIIVGFPGETEEEFSETMALAEECAFTKIHVFPYSMREGTPAAERKDQIPAEVKQRRAAELRKLSSLLAQKDFQKRMGTTEWALVEQEGVWMTESYHALAAPRTAPVGSLVKYTFSPNEHATMDE